MVGADVELPVLEHDELAAVPALLCPAAAVALVLRQAALRSGFQDSEDYRGGGAQRQWWAKWQLSTFDLYPGGKGMGCRDKYVTS
jgi:hypothetical protein